LFKADRQSKCDGVCLRQTVKVSLVPIFEHRFARRSHDI